VPKTKRTRTGSDLDEVLDVFGRAQQLYPRLIAQREFHAAELAKLDAALAKLQHVVGGASAPRAGSSAPAVKRGRPRSNGAAGEGTLASIVLAALSGANGPLNAAELIAAVRTKREVGKANLQNVLRDLRAKGLVKADGKAKRFSYTLGKSGAPTLRAGAAKASAKRGKNQARGARGSGPSLRDAAVAALGKGNEMPRAELIKAMLATRPDAKASSAGVTIDNLRRDGVVKASGEKKAYRYSLATAAS
jgi:DNA-binding PadR family transcriptional regulator